jgi:hypothetical protein
LHRFSKPDFFQFVQVDLTAYVEKHEFVFDAVLDQYVSNDEVSCKLPFLYILSTRTLVALALMLMMMMLGIIGVSYNSGANCTHNLSTHKGNMLCIWANRQA